MSKVKPLISGLVLSAALLLIDVTPAAAHQGAHGDRYHDRGYVVEVKRQQRMPRWLRRNQQFRHWYRHSPFKQYRRIGWNELYDIYRWERRYFSGRYYDDDGHRGRRGHRYRNG